MRLKNYSNRFSIVGALFHFIDPTKNLMREIKEYIQYYFRFFAIMGKNFSKLMKTFKLRKNTLSSCNFFEINFYFVKKIQFSIKCG